MLTELLSLDVVDGELNNNPLVMMTDQYQLAMACAHWKNGTHERQATFQLYFRRCPFGGSYVINAGLQSAVEYLQNFHFSDEQISHLATLKSASGDCLFPADFLSALSSMTFSCDVDAITEGEVVFPNEPIMQITGPIWQAHIIESTLLNIINFQSLVATKASRIRSAAGDDKLFEFGLRRAQGLAAISVARASFIGGFDGTSNLLAGQLMGIPTVGTHAHSWVMAHDSELAAFAAFADAMPTNCVLLVDTYNTISGIDNAIIIGNKLRERGHDLLGIRLDSGDLAYFSQIAREKLDAAGFPEALIMASNELDEQVIESLKQSQQAKINAWGVGTKLATCYDDAALSGVYKLSAIEQADGHWEDKIKLSEQRAKMTIPGALSAYRYYDDNGRYVADAITQKAEKSDAIRRIIDPQDNLRQKKIKVANSYALLQPLFRNGKLVSVQPTIEDTKALAQSSLSSLDDSHKRLHNPHQYPVGLSEQLDAHRDELMRQAAERYSRDTDDLR